MTYFDGLRERTGPARGRCATCLSSEGLDLRAKPKTFILDTLGNGSLQEARMAKGLASYWRHTASSAISAFAIASGTQSDYSRIFEEQIKFLNDDLVHRDSLALYIGFVFSVDSTRCDVEATAPALADGLWADLRGLVKACGEGSTFKLMEASAFSVYQAIEQMVGGLALIKHRDSTASAALPAHRSER